MNVHKRIRFTLAVLAIGLSFGARAVTITSEFDDRAVKYVIRDATRMIGSFDGEIALKADPSVPDRSWRFVSDGGKRLTIFGNDEKGVIYGLYTFLEKYMGCRERTRPCLGLRTSRTGRWLETSAFRDGESSSRTARSRWSRQERC